MSYHLFSRDGRGVSPVIGVIFMVGIVVILAALIGAFVLGESATEPTPSTSFTASPNAETGQVEIRHNSGDTITGDCIDVVGLTNVTAPDEITSGDVIVGDPTDATELRITHNCGDGTSATLATLTIGDTVQYFNTPPANYCVESVSYDGSGTTTDPYLVSDPYELQCINEDKSAQYMLAGNIDASGTASWNDGDGFSPIGESGNSFTGGLDGDGHQISGLTIDRSTEQRVGLFGDMRSGASVSGVELVGVSITGDSRVGGVSGYGDGTMVDDVVVSGSVSGADRIGGVIGSPSGVDISNTQSSATVSGETRVGGITGMQSGVSIEDSHASGDIIGVNRVGGVAGESRSGSEVIDSYSTGEITGDVNTGGVVGYQEQSSVTGSYASGVVSGSYKVGGLVGYSELSSISGSYAEGSVSGDLRRVGGLVGVQEGASIEDSYASGDVSGADERIGGLAGESRDSSTIETSYAVGSVSGDADSGGLVGIAFTSTTSDSYWDVESTGEATSAGGVGLTTDEMTGDAAETNMDGFDFMVVWETVSGGYPVLAG